MTAGLPLIKKGTHTISWKCTRTIRNKNSSNNRSSRVLIKTLGSEKTGLIISNEEMENTLKTVKSFEDSSLLTKVVTKSMENETEAQGEGFLVLLSALCRV